MLALNGTKGANPSSRGQLAIKAAGVGHVGHHSADVEVLSSFGSPTPEVGLSWFELGETTALATTFVTTPDTRCSLTQPCRVLSLSRR